MHKFNFFTFLISLFIVSSINANETFNFTNINFKMIYVRGGLVFPYSNENKEIVLKNAFLIGDTELTYELWKLVYDWATKNGYEFKNAGSIGSNDVDTKHPVTNIAWEDAVVFSNAITEYFNTLIKTEKQSKLIFNYYYKSKDAVLTPIKIFANNLEIISLKNSTGFRLLSSYEWELAARYLGPTIKSHQAINIMQNNSINLNIPFFWLNQNSISVNDPSIARNITDFAWFIENSENKAQKVAEKVPNALSVYDMSGNVSEFVFDKPFLRGGSCSDGQNKLVVSFIENNINNKNPSIYSGFRLGMNSK